MKELQINVLTLDSIEQDVSKLGITLEEALNRIALVKEHIKSNGGALNLLINYTLEKIILKRPHTEDELIKQLDVFFCNGLSTETIQEVALVYSAYDGVLSIVPLSGEHESYFNINTDYDILDSTMRDIYHKQIFDLWNKLKTI